MNNFMNIAIEEARQAEKRNEVPVGAIIVSNNVIISKAGNEVLASNDPTAHAEILAIRRACTWLQSHLLENCDIYVTLEPCAMCAQAISLARINRLFFGAYDSKFGAVTHGARIFEHSIHKTEIISGVFESHCSIILKDFFKKRRF